MTRATWPVEVEPSLARRCSVCLRDQRKAGSCRARTATFDDGVELPLVPYGSEPWHGDMPICSGCGVARGGTHHYSCPEEQCAAHLGRWVECSACGEVEL